MFNDTAYMVFYVRVIVMLFHSDAFQLWMSNL